MEQGMKRKIATTNRMVKRFKEDWKEFSFKVALGRIIRDCPFFSWEVRRNYYEKQVYSYIKNEYEDVVKKCVQEYKEEQSTVCDTRYIWVMWWQGEEAMPPIVKACYSSLTRAAGDNEVILITENNWKQYVELPQVIIDKLNNKNISLTHFSDIMRVALLKKWGGIWIDATVYVDVLPEQMLTDEFYTLRAPGLFPDFISRGDWIPFIICFKKKNSLFTKCLLKIFELYWSEHTQLIDYLMIDYCIKLLINSVPDIHRMIESVSLNKEYYMLNLAINRKYRVDELEEMLRKSPLQKLTYKKDFLIKTKNGEETYYSFLLRKEKIDYE